MKNFFITFFSLIILGIFSFLPFYSYADVSLDVGFEKGENLIPCGNDKNPIVKTSKGETGGEVTNPCTAEHFIIMVNKILEFILIYLVLPIATIVFMYAGFLLLFSGGDTHKRSEAKSMFMNVLWGLVFIAGAWLIVNTILSILGFQGSTILK